MECALLSGGLFCYFSHLPPSQGGRYAGFGNTVEKKKEDDLLENTLSSLASVSILYSYFMSVCCIVKTFTWRCRGRPDALLHSAYGLAQ